MPAIIVLQNQNNGKRVRMFCLKISEKAKVLNKKVFDGVLKLVLELVQPNWLGVLA